MRVSEFFGFGDFLLSAKIARQTAVFACPLEENAQKVIESNFDITTHVGLDGLLIHEIPRTDLVCLKTSKEAVKAAELIVRLFPRAIILEKRKKADNSEDVVKRIVEAGFERNEETYSATEFGLPQDSKRTFVVLVRSNATALGRFHFPDGTSRSEPSFAQVMQKNADKSLWPKELPKDCRIISPHECIPASPKDVLVNDGGSLRKLSVIESRRAFGIPDEFKMPIPDSKVQTILARSTWIPACTEIIKELSEWLI